MMRPRVLLVATLVCASLAVPARADEPSGERFPDPETPLGLLPTPEDALIDPKMARSWATLPARAFVATTVDVGFVYVRPRISLGYGRPFTEWVGVDANPIAATGGLGAYGGVRLQTAYFDLRLGPRYFSSFEHTYLAPKAAYDRIDLERDEGQLARTLTFETELDAGLRMGPGRLLLRASVSYVTGVPEGDYVYEETLHIIVEPPWVFRGRLGYVFSFGLHDQHSVGPAVDVLNVLERDPSTSVRVGPVLRMQLSRRVDVRGSFIFTVLSPDRIGLRGGDFTELGVRYRWASE